ncbi:hypothetical protein D9615_008351 [Tricholomella constricta]|uniref:Uncharacterized protein n=1 Tax=Tricholomella constricta TaxID=117010 RepID=A0A8H5HDN1_9AGAR|nr:hypothetical protein D9615_008351 [Tricholomella constricta]
MKFARYLQDTQTPEWKKAYIDYRGLKKRITAIRKAQEGLSSDPPSSEPEDGRNSQVNQELGPEPRPHQTAPEPAGDYAIPIILHEPVTPPPAPKHAYFEELPRASGSIESLHWDPNVVTKARRGSASASATRGRRPSFVTSIRRGLGIDHEAEGDRADEPERLYDSQDPLTPSRHAIFNDDQHAAGSLESVTRDPPLTSKPGRMSNANANASTRGRRPSFAYPKSLPSFRRGQNPKSTTSGSGLSRPTNPMEVLPLNEVLAQLNPTEQAFFTALDSQLDKIESFYTTRESEMLARSKMLHEQLEELSDHKKLVQAKHSRYPASWSSALMANLTNKLCLTKQSHKAATYTTKPGNGNGSGKGHGNLDLPWVSLSPVVYLSALHQRLRAPPNQNQHQHQHQKRGSVGSDSLGKGKDKEESEEDERLPPGTGRRVGLSTDPEDYLYAKKKLKKAVLEHYRGLEVLQNYRILNLTGFRKALKKFEKTTKIQAQRQYMTEKVNRSAFSSDKHVQGMMRDMENLYATRFARGDKKRAMTRLRAGFTTKSHHYSVFRSGILLGLALPAFVSGLHASFQQSTRDAIPGWDGLLFIYGVMLVPVLFSVLVGANLLVWARARINYVFIFELDTRTRMDYREYYEIPSILLAALSYAFWLSFLRIGAPHISPTIWPLVWLGFCALVMVDPLPLFYKSSRYWLLRNVGKLLMSGSRRVEFTDFWMGDQFCSLVFTLSNMYLFACVYARGFDDDWTKCGVTGSPRWPVAFVLASLPFLIRLVQSVKRYCDSGLATHMINGGKYGSSIVSNLFFYVWRHQGPSTSRGTIFALWLLFSTVSSLYSSTWDFLMDWSVLRWRTRYPLLRPELVYSDSIPFYYIAIVTNVLLRFIWVIYIPAQGPSMFLRTFVAAMLEMLRRWMWNFYRLENEHLGNMDQYRVTREVPLPYSFDDARAAAEGHGADDEEDEDEEDKALAAAVVAEKKGAKGAGAGAGAKKGGGGVGKVPGWEKKGM